MEEHEHIDRVKAKLWKYSLFCAVSFIPPIIAIYTFSIISPYLPEDETLSIWFQRSGSLMVIIAIITEFKLFSLNDYFDLNDTRMYAPVDLPKIYKSVYFVVTIMALMSMLIGTLIWGYGDIIV